MLYLCTNIPKMYSKKKYPVYFCCCVECLRRIQFLICMQMRVVIHIISAFYLSFWLSAVCFFFSSAAQACGPNGIYFPQYLLSFFPFIQPTSRWRIIAALHGARFFCRGSIEKKDGPQPWSSEHETETIQIWNLSVS